MELTFNRSQLLEMANTFWEQAGSHTVIAFHGAMGAGKTTFIHALCDVRKVKDVVSSPTFSIINEYYFEENGMQKKIFHIDLYRLKDEQEAMQAGVEDCIYSDHICMIEWPEKIPHLLPAGTLHVHLEVIDAETRKIILPQIATGE
jgi:tRNA threonylcarbamoyladenosine biosynthesis protein TsaE